MSYLHNRHIVKKYSVALHIQDDSSQTRPVEKSNRRYEPHAQGKPTQQESECAKKIVVHYGSVSRLFKIHLVLSRVSTTCQNTFPVPHPYLSPTLHYPTNNLSLAGFSAISIPRINRGYAPNVPDTRSGYIGLPGKARNCFIGPHSLRRPTSPGVLGIRLTITPMTMHICSSSSGTVSSDTVTASPVSPQAHQIHDIIGKR